MTTTTRSKTQDKARLEARIPRELDTLIAQAADLTHGGNKSAFVCEAAREAALKVVTRADVTLMDPEVFDRMMASLEIPDASPELAALVAKPRQIDW